mmetsp:Transcript_22939/g.56677  ORF Transcript_22939/g.56677 Transcript_22939/m.56677 type:complete len:94 (-) Transcript_22939:586-867(-)
MCLRLVKLLACILLSFVFLSDAQGGQLAVQQQHPVLLMPRDGQVQVAPQGAVFSLFLSDGKSFHSDRPGAYSRYSACLTILGPCLESEHFSNR